MLTCIPCTKQVAEEEDKLPGNGGGAHVGCSGGGGNGTPSSKEAVKSLTAQIKDMASKVSCAYRECKPCMPSRSDTKRPCPRFDRNSEGIPFPDIGGSSTSTPAWKFTRHLAFRYDAELGRALGGDCPRGGLSVSGQYCDVVREDEGESKEWTAQVEPGVHITLISLQNGGNDLKRIRFSRDMFNKWQAQRWWGKNYERIMELYNVQSFSHQALNTPARSEDENNAGSGAYGMSRHRVESSVDASRITASSRDDAFVSISNASDIDFEWVEQDEPGVYITIRQLVDGTRELRRVRFSREMFGEVNAKLWWEENRERILAQYPA